MATSGKFSGRVEVSHYTLGGLPDVDHFLSCWGRYEPTFLSARIWGCAGCSGRSSRGDSCSVGALSSRREPMGDCPQTPCDALARPWRMGAGPSRRSCGRGNRWSSRKAGGTPIRMPVSARWRVTWSASSARVSAAVSASTSSPGPTKPCRPSSWRWSRQSVRSAQCACHCGD